MPRSQTSLSADFKDDWVAIQWTTARKDLSVKVRNRATEVLQVRWDRARFISVEGTEHRIIDRGVPYRDRERPKPPTMLNPGAARRESIYPADFLYWQAGKVIDYMSKDVYPEMPGLAAASRERAERFARNQVGKSIAIRLPVDGRSESREYLFTFTVKNFHIAKFLGT